jgi:hypothetical protein
MYGTAPVVIAAYAVRRLTPMIWAYRLTVMVGSSSGSGTRNEYLHGSGIAFMVLEPQAWWPRYWALAAILVTAQDREMEDLVGRDRIAVVEGHLEQNSKNIEHRTEALIARATQRVSQYRAGTLPMKVQMEWQSHPNLTARPRYSVRETCPACGAAGTLE